MASVAVYAYLVLIMAINTEAHTELIDLPDSVHMPDISMASAAVDISCQMNLMLEVNKIGDSVHSHPGNTFSPIVVVKYLVDRWKLRCYNAVA
jgi:hypothetical protein